MPVQYPEASNPEEQLPSLGLEGRREEAVYRGCIWRRSLDRAVALARGTKPNHSDLAERKPRKISLSSLLPNPRKNQSLKRKDITPTKKSDESKLSPY